MVLLIVFGLPARMLQINYRCGMSNILVTICGPCLLFFGFGLALPMSTFKVAMFTLFFTYSIEISQLYHPQWLEYLRSIKLFGLVLGYGFLCSDLLAYTLGISTGALIDIFNYEISHFSKFNLLMKRKFPYLLIILGILIIFIGFVYDVLFAGIPYQDPTPAMSASYDYHSDCIHIPLERSGYRHTWQLMWL